MSDAEVIQLFSDVERAESNAPLTNKPREFGKFCRHGRIELSRKNRRAYCKDCGEERDLFDVLSRFSNDYERYIEAWKHSEREAKAARARLDDLLRQERNAKARLRTATKKLYEDHKL